MRIQARCKRKACRAIASSSTAVRCPKCRGPVSYSIRYTATDGRRETKSFAHYESATAFVRTREARLAEGAWTEPSRGKATLRDYFDGWIGDVRKASAKAWADGDRGVLARRTVEKYESVFRLHVDAHLGDYALGAVTEVAVEDMRDAIRSPYQANEAVKLTRRILSRAVREKRLTVNVASGTKLRTASRKTPIRVLEADEVERIVAAIEPRYRALVRLLYVGGFRWSEAVGLQRGDVDVKARLVEVSRTLNQTRTGDGSFYVGPPKTGKARRVKIDDETAVELAEHMLAYQARDLAFGELIFTGPKGAPLRARVFAKAWKAALAEAGIDENVRVGWLRHSCATVMLRANVSPKLVAEQLGHTSTRMVDAVYVKVTDDAMRDAMDVVVAWKAARRAAEGNAR